MKSKEEELKEEIERKNKEIEEKVDILFQKIISLNPEKQEKLLVAIRPIIGKIEEMNKSLKKNLREEKEERRNRADGN